MICLETMSCKFELMSLFSRFHLVLVRFVHIIPSSISYMLRFEELGLGFELGGEIKAAPEVADLLLCACYAAANGGRLVSLCVHQGERVRAGEKGKGNILQPLRFLHSPS